MSSTIDKKGILVTRTDRIGDLVLSLPVLDTLKKIFPDEPLYILVSSYAAPVVENYKSVDMVIQYDPSNESNLSLINEIKNLECRLALMLVYDKNILSLIKKAGIKKRFGPLNKISSIFNYTSWQAQHRSKVEKHELEYNLDLLKLLGLKENLFLKDIAISVSDVALLSVYNKLKNIDVDLKKESSFIIIHSTMGGSALNWRYSYYIELAIRLYKKFKVPVLFTGANEDYETVNLMLSHNINNFFIKNIAGMFNLKELIALISKARVLIAPSTGPMHLATAVGTPVVGLFSKLKVQSAKRWGPYSIRAKVLSAKLKCPEKLNCKTTSCRYYNCMDTISVDDVLEATSILFNADKKQMGFDFDRYK